MDETLLESLTGELHELAYNGDRLRDALLRAGADLSAVEGAPLLTALQRVNRRLSRLAIRLNRLAPLRRARPARPPRGPGGDVI
jgi:hypothetical protein